MLCNSGQGENKQDEVFVEFGVVNKLVASEYGNERPVAYFGLGQTGTELIHTDREEMSLCSFEAMALTPKSYIKRGISISVRKQIKRRR